MEIGGYDLDKYAQDKEFVTTGIYPSTDTGVALTVFEMEGFEFGEVGQS